MLRITVIGVSGRLQSVNCALKYFYKKSCFKITFEATLFIPIPGGENATDSNIPAHLIWQFSLPPYQMPLYSAYILNLHYGQDVEACKGSINAVKDTLYVLNGK